MKKIVSAFVIEVFHEVNDVRGVGNADVVNGKVVAAGGCVEIANGEDEFRSWGCKGDRVLCPSGPIG